MPVLSAVDVTAPEIKVVSSRLSVTPPPIIVNWYKYRTSDLNVKPATDDTRFAFTEKLDQANDGFAAGVVTLPVDGKWLLQLYLGGPSYDRSAADSQAWPSQSTGVPDPTDSIIMNFNGVQQTWTNSVDKQGKKTMYTQVVDGQEVSFRFDFKSSNSVRRLHPFISNGQLTLIQDRSSPPTLSSPTGQLVGKCTNAVDGKLIKPGDKVSNGDPPNLMEIPATTEVMLLLFVGSTLVTTVPVKDGSFSITIPSGKYGVIATMPHFYSFFVQDFQILPGQTNTLNVMLSPLLNPGVIRIILRWGAIPKDLDSYLLALPADSKPQCLVNYKTKKCDRYLFFVSNTFFQFNKHLIAYHSISCLRFNDDSILLQHGNVTGHGLYKWVWT